MIFQKMLPMLKRPPVYTRTAVPFWDDEHISKQMLDAHLNPEFEGASRKHDYISRSVAWIEQTVPASEYKYLLDLGCGPGIYAEKFAAGGYQVTGVDFSRRSIKYATESAAEKGLDIRYLYRNYLHIELDEQFDFATMIYCDYGALSMEDRQTLMATVYRHLKPGGLFLLDVFSMEQFNCFKEDTSWEINHEGGFWHPGQHVVFNGSYRYPDAAATLRQATVISPERESTYYLWDTYFSKESLAQEAEAAGFRVRGVFGDVAGKEYGDDSPTIAVLLAKD